MTELIERIGKNIHPWNACVGYTKEMLLKDIDEAIATARAGGAKAMRDYIMLTGVTIDGKDYIPLDDAFRRAKEWFEDEALTTKEHHAE